MSLVFLKPAFLWLALLLPLIWFLPSRVRDVRHAAIRTLVLLLLVLGLARPALLQTEDEAFQVVIWDRSPSVFAGADDTKVVDSLMRRLPNGERSHLLVVQTERAPPVP